MRFDGESLGYYNNDKVGGELVGRTLLSMSAAAKMSSLKRFCSYLDVRSFGESLFPYLANSVPSS